MKKTAAKKRSDAWRDGVRKRDDGMWAVRLTWHDEEGKRHDTERVVDVSSRAAAMAKREELLAELSAPKGIGMTFKEAWDIYFASLKNANTRKHRKSTSKRILAKFGTRRLSSITTLEAQRFLMSIQGSDELSLSVRKAFTAVYKHVIRAGLYGGANPVAQTIRRHTEKSPEEEVAAVENPPKRAYFGDEAARLLEALPEPIRTMQAIQLLLGCRFHEVSALEWRDIDLDTGVVRIRRGQGLGHVTLPKKKKIRDTALGPHALGMLAAHRERMAELQWPGWQTLIFPCDPAGRRKRDDNYWRYGAVRNAIMLAQESIGSDVVARTHAMRHTHITMAEVKEQMDRDAALGAQLSSHSRELHKQMTGHASEEQRANYVDMRALPPTARLARDIEKHLLTTFAEHPETP